MKQPLKQHRQGRDYWGYWLAISPRISTKGVSLCWPNHQHTAKWLERSSSLVPFIRLQIADPKCICDKRTYCFPDRQLLWIHSGLWSLLLASSASPNWPILSFVWNSHLFQHPRAPSSERKQCTLFTFGNSPFRSAFFLVAASSGIKWASSNKIRSWIRCSWVCQPS